MGRWIFACDAMRRAWEIHFENYHRVLYSQAPLHVYKYTQFRTVIVQSECIRGVFHVNYYFSKHTLCVQDIRVAL
jgi:hypothetical protein